MNEHILELIKIMEERRALSSGALYFASDQAGYLLELLEVFRRETETQWERVRLLELEVEMRKSGVN
jgi:hypothetical protein